MARLWMLLLALLLPLAAPRLHAQQPAELEGKRVGSIELATSSGGRVFDRAPDSARSHDILVNLRTRVGTQFRQAELDKDLAYLTTTSHMFRAAESRVEADAAADSVRVRLILTQPMVHRLAVLGPENGRYTEDGAREFWRQRSLVDSAEGAEFSLNRMDGDVRRLMASGAFLDVRADYRYTAQGVVLTFRVTPNRPLAVVQFSGVYQTGFSADLSRVISGRAPVRDVPGQSDEDVPNLPSYFPQEALEGEVVTDANPASILGATTLIELFYRYRGFRFVKVNPRLFDVPAQFDAAAVRQDYGDVSDAALDVLRGLVDRGYAGRLALVFEVFEGPRLLVGEVRFSGIDETVPPPGSDALSSTRLQGMFGSLYQLWYGVLSSNETERAAVLGDMIRSKVGDAFVEGDVIRDAELLEGYLQSRGWLDARVSFANYQLNQSRSRVVLWFQVSPGPLYAADELRIEYATRFPRVPRGVAQPEYEAPVVTFEEVLKALEFTGESIPMDQALARYGSDALAGLDNPEGGKYFAAWRLTRAVAWDEQALEGDARAPGAATRVRELLADRGYSNITLEWVRVETMADELPPEVAALWEQPLPIKRVAMILRIDQGYKSYVGNVTFRGNDSTREEVLRREVSLYPGELYNNNKRERSDNRLRRTQWFEIGAPGFGVVSRPTPRLLQVGDQIIEYTDIDYEVVEGRTNAFNFAAGFSSANGFSASVDLTLRNFDISSALSWAWGDPNWSFTGAGQQFSISIQPPLDRQQRYSVSFTEPWLFGYPWMGGISAEHQVIDRGLYSQGRTGVDPFVGWRVFPDVVWSFGYSYAINTLSDVSSRAPDEIARSEGSDRESTLWSQIAWTTTDNPQFPTTGFNLVYRYAYTGGMLGGDLDFWRMNAKGEYYLPVAQVDRIRTLVLAFSAQAWWQDVHSDMEQIPFFSRFLLGGNPMTGRGVLRGFEYGGVGPSRRGEAIGGNFMLHGFAELRMPVLPGTLWLIGFVDAGSLAPTMNTFDPDSLTVSAGFGLRLLLPVLPVPFALDFGFPLRNQPGNREEVISINLGFGF